MGLIETLARHGIVSDDSIASGQVGFRGGCVAEAE